MCLIFAPAALQTSSYLKTWIVCDKMQQEPLQLWWEMQRRLLRGSVLSGRPQSPTFYSFKRIQKSISHWRCKRKCRLLSRKDTCYRVSFLLFTARSRVQKAPSSSIVVRYDVQKANGTISSAAAGENQSRALHILNWYLTSIWIVFCQPIQIDAISNKWFLLHYWGLYNLIDNSFGLKFQNMNLFLILFVEKRFLHPRVRQGGQPIIFQLLGGL